MSEYVIQRWDALKLPKDSQPRPCMYLIETDELHQLLQSEQRVGIKIMDTLSGYDNKICWARLVESKDTGGYRPNFQAETHSLVLVPELTWSGYPRQLGRVKLLLEENDSLPSPDPSTDSFMDYEWIAVLSLLVVLSGIMYMSVRAIRTRSNSF
jgi:hypothetical protein